MTYGKDKVWTDDPRGPHTDIIPTKGHTINIGSPDKPFKHVYADHIVADHGYRGYYPLATEGCQMRFGLVNGAGVRTARSRHIALFDASSIVLIYGNFRQSGGLELLGNNPMNIRASLEKVAGGNLNAQTAPRPWVTARGARLMPLDVGSFLITDPVPFEVNKNERFFVRTGVFTSNTEQYMGGGGLVGGTGIGGLNSGEGAESADRVYDGSGNINISTTGGQCYPVLILGKPRDPSYRPKSIIFLGDSIISGLDDGGFKIQRGGPFERYATGQLSRVYSLNATPKVAYTAFGINSEILGRMENASQSYARRWLAQFHDTVVNNCGTNDLPSLTVAQIKAKIVNIAWYYLSQNKNYIHTTFLPRTTSTDGWLTIANQSVTSFESKRVEVNNWLRDTGPDGFVTNVLSTYKTTKKVAVIDICKNFEMNSQGVYALNGGYWPPAQAASLVTGSITSITGASYTDSIKNWTLNQWKGYVVEITSGAALGQRVSIAGNTANIFETLAIISPTPAVGDTYKIYDPYTRDGLHPTSISNVLIAQNIDLKDFI
jgi:hypothetical protein